MNGARVGVVGDGELAAAIEAGGGDPVVGDPSALGSVEFVVAAGERAVSELARRKVAAPVLPVGVEGLRSVTAERLSGAVGSVLGGDARTAAVPVIETGGSASVTAVFDIALMAAEPARISEFSVRTRGEPISQFRADGVVASTPAGSFGYNRRAGGASIEPGTGVASVVPIAPFAIEAGEWVLPIGSVRLAVERDETPVELLADGRRERRVPAGAVVELAVADELRTYVVPESGDVF